MRKLAMVTILGSAMSCGGRDAEPRTASQAPATQDATGGDAEGEPSLRIQPMTLLQGGAPVARIRKDGVVDVFGEAAFKLYPDGRAVEGQATIARLAPDGRITESRLPSLETLRVTDSELLHKGKTMVRVEGDGTLSLIPPPEVDRPEDAPGWRIDGPVEGRRAALYTFALFMAGMAQMMDGWLGSGSSGKG